MQHDIKKVLVVTKYRFIGDTLIAIPTIRSVKERWPEASISILTGARACELLQNCPYIDKVFEFDPYRLSDKGLGKYLSLIGKLRREAFDVALVLNRSFHSALTATLGGARKRAGWAGFEGRDFLLTDRCEYSKEKPEIDCFLDVFRVAALAEPASRKLELWLSPDELQESRRFVDGHRPVIGIQPGATHGYKQWPIERFIAMAEELMDLNSDCQFVIVGGAEERTIADKFVGGASAYLASRTTNLVGQLSLRLTLGLLPHLDLFVGNDTAIRHAAVAIDTPSVGIFGPTSSKKWGNSAPPRHEVVTSPSGNMEHVLVKDVMNAIQSLPCTTVLRGQGCTGVNELQSQSVGVKV